MKHNPFLSWWGAVQADAELAGQPLGDDAMVLSYSGNGMGVYVTAGHIRALLSDYAAVHKSLGRAWSSYLDLLLSELAHPDSEALLADLRPTLKRLLQALENPQQTEDTHAQED